MVHEREKDIEDMKKDKDDKELDKKKKLIGLKLREIRQVKRMSMRDVAEHSIISKAQVSRLEHGVYLPRLSTLYSLAKAYGMERNHFLRLIGLEPRAASAEYREIPVVLSKSGAAEMDFNYSTHRIPYVAAHCPKHCFFVRIWDNKDGIKPLIHEGSLVLVNQDYEETSGDVYAVFFYGRILIGRVYWSKKKCESGKHHATVLVINKRSFFSGDYDRKAWKILGKAHAFIDDF